MFVRRGPKEDIPLNEKPTQEMIYVKGLEGLGNRMFSLEYAARLAAVWDRELYVDWEDPMYSVNQETFSEFFTLTQVRHCSVFESERFESPYPHDISLFTMGDIRGVLSKPRRIEIIPNFLAPWRRVSRLSGRFIVASQPWKFVLSGEHIRPKLCKHDLVLFLCELPFREPERFRHLKWNCARIEREVAKIGLSATPDIAIHIRNTDKKGSSGEVALKQLNLMLADVVESQHIHLATDSSADLDLIRSNIDVRHKLTSIDMSRDSRAIHLRDATEKEARERFVQALVDMYILASSKQLIYQSNSSFSRIALGMRDPLKYAFNTTPHLFT